MAVGTIVAASLAYFAFRKQSEEVRDQAGMLKVQSDRLAEQRKINEKQAEILALQADELKQSLIQRQREAEERRRAQASQVYMWEIRSTHVELYKSPQDVVTAHVRNASGQPVYDVRFSWHSGNLPVGVMMLAAPLNPNEQESAQAPVPEDVDPEKFGAAVIFRDRAGLWWRTRPNGRLEELPPGSEPPHSW